VKFDGGRSVLVHNACAGCAPSKQFLKQDIAAKAPHQEANMKKLEITCIGGAALGTAAIFALPCVLAALGLGGAAAADNPQLAQELEQAVEDLEPELNDAAAAADAADTSPVEPYPLAPPYEPPTFPRPGPDVPETPPIEPYPLAPPYEPPTFPRPGPLPPDEPAPPPIEPYPLKAGT
jgi:hypothetical protein